MDKPKEQKFKVPPYTPAELGKLRNTPPWEDEEELASYADTYGIPYSVLGLDDFGSPLNY